METPWNLWTSLLILHKCLLLERLLSVPDPKPTPARIAFSIARGERYTRRMRSGDETVERCNLQATINGCTAYLHTPWKSLPPMSKTLGNWLKFHQTPPTVLINIPHSAPEMTSSSETRTRTLRYILRSRGIYIKEPIHAIASPEILSEPPPTQDDSINTVQETPNSWFRLILSVMPCMPHTSSLEYINHSSFPLLFSPTPTPNPAHVPTSNSPQDQPPPPPT